MAFNLGELKAVVSLDTSSLTGAVSPVTAALGSIGGGFTALAGTIAVVGTAVAAAGVALTTKFVKDGLQAGTEMEQVRTAFNTMIGDAELAGKTLADLSKFSRETPFELPEVLTASKQLLAYGFSTDELIPKLKMVGDVAAGLSIPVGDLTYLFGTLKAQGTAYTKDLNQFANRGLPIYDELAKVLGITTDKVRDYAEQSKISYDDVEKAFENMTGEGGKFFNMMDAQSKTAGGIVSNLKDSFYQLSLALVGVDPTGAIKEGGLFDKFKTILQDLLTVLNNNRDKIVEIADKFGNLLSGALQTVIDGVKWLINNWKDLKQRGEELIRNIDAQTGIFTGLKDEFTAIVDLVKNDLIPTIIKNKDVFIDIGKAIGTIVVVAVFMFLEAVKLAIQIISRAIDFLGWWREKWNQLRDAIIGFPQFIKSIIDAIYNFGVSIGKGIVDNINKAIAYFELFKITVGLKLTVMAQQAIQWGASIIQGIIDGITGAYNNLVSAVTNAAENVKNAFKNALGIHSPSTVFEEYGEYTVEGFTQGIDNRKGDIQKRIDDIDNMLDTWAREDLADTAKQSKQRKLEIFDLKQERASLQNQLKLIDSDFKAFEKTMSDFGDSMDDVKQRAVDAVDKFKGKIKDVKQAYEDFRKSIKEQRQQENEAFASDNAERKADLASSVAEEIVSLKEKQKEITANIAEEQALGADASQDKITSLQAELDSVNTMLSSHSEDQKTYSNEVAELEKFNALDAIDQIKYKYEQEQALADEAHTAKMEGLKQDLADEELATSQALDRIRDRRKKVLKDIRDDFKDTTEKIKGFLGEITESTAGAKLFNTITSIGTTLAKFIGKNVDVQKFADGGIVRGSGGIDTVPALLTPGERVLKPGETYGSLTVQVYGNTVQSDSDLADIIIDKINRSQERNQLFGSI